MCVCLCVCVRARVSVCVLLLSLSLSFFFSRVFFFFSKKAHFDLTFFFSLSLLCDLPFKSTLCMALIKKIQKSGGRAFFHFRPHKQKNLTFETSLSFCLICVSDARARALSLSLSLSLSRRSRDVVAVKRREVIQSVGSIDLF